MISEDETFELLLCTLVDVVMSVLFPFLSTLAERIAQLTKEEIKIFVCFRESFFKFLIQLIDFVLLGSILNEVVEKLKILASMSQIRLTLHLPAFLQMAWNDFSSVQRCYEVK